MPPPPWWRTILSRPGGNRRPRPVRPLWLEVLEGRTLPDGDPLTSATPLTFQFNTAHAPGFLSGPADFDLYRVRLEAGDRLTAGVAAQSAGSGLQSLLRVFGRGR